jgi:hypothetical protein
MGSHASASGPVVVSPVLIERPVSGALTAPVRTALRYDVTPFDADVEFVDRLPA